MATSVIDPRGDVGGPHSRTRPVVRVELHVRPRAAATVVGGTHDGALLARVTEPAHEGRATTAALRAVADALGVPPRSVTLVRGATARRKLIEITVAEDARPDLEARLVRLRSE